MWVSAETRGFGQGLTYLNIKNPGPTHLFITGMKCSAPGYFVTDSNTVAGIARALTGHPALALLAPGETKSFSLSRRETEPKNDVRVTVSWRDTSWTWLPQIPKRAWTTHNHLESMIKAAERAAKETADD